MTINYNNDEGLRRTILSVRNQSYSNIQYIIVDGGSKDDSNEIVQDNIGIVSDYICEPDNGIYDAMNKGLNHATGAFCLFMNSGDTFRDKNSLELLVQGGKLSLPTLIFGRAEIQNTNNRSFFLPGKSVRINDLWLSKYSPNHQSILFPKEFYKNERYDTSYQIAGDIDYIRRAINFCEGRYCFIDDVVVVFGLGGVSNSFKPWSKLNKQIAESIRVKRSYFGLTSMGKYWLMIKFYIKNLFAYLMGRRFYSSIIWLNKLKSR